MRVRDEEDHFADIATERWLYDCPVETFDFDRNSWNGHSIFQVFCWRRKMMWHSSLMNRIINIHNAHMESSFSDIHIHTFTFTVIAIIICTWSVFELIERCVCSHISCWYAHRPVQLLLPISHIFAVRSNMSTDQIFTSCKADGNK